MNVRAVHRSVAAGGPATAEGQAGGVIPAPNVDAAGSARPGHLRMAAETEIGIGRGEQLGIDGTVRAMAHRAALPQGRVFVNHGPGLLPMALGTGLI